MFEDSNGDGFRTAKTVDEERTEYIYTPSWMCLYETTNGKRTSYVHGPKFEEILCQIRPDRKPEYLMHDHQMSVTGINFPNYARLIDYNPFGEIRNFKPEEIETEYLFNGRRYDRETGLYHYRNRQYSTAVGRFTTVDPIGFRGGLNLYRYCANNPVNYVDPLGYFKLTLKPKVGTVRVTVSTSSNNETVTTAVSICVTPVGAAAQGGATLGVVSVIIKEVIDAKMNNREYDQTIIDAAQEVGEEVLQFDQQIEYDTPLESGGGGASGSWDNDDDGSCAE